MPPPDQGDSHHAPHHRGGSPDVTPSGLLNGMSGGRRVYTFVPGAGRVDEETVDIFAPARADQVVTVEEQRVAVFRLHGLPDSVMRDPDGG